VFNVRKDLESIYMDLGYACTLPNASEVYLIQDNTFEEEDSSILTTRALSGHGIKRADAVTFRGFSYQVVKVSPYNEVEDEDIVHLKRMS